MSVINFQTTVKNGSITIPSELRGQITGQIDVTVKVKDEEKNSKAKNFLREMIENPMVDRNFVPLTREEIYDRI